jgi:dTDP-4-dehydrorhamnose reductase
MKILIIGASGLVGSHVLAEAVFRGHEVVGTYRANPWVGLVKLDLADPDATAELLRSISPDWVVHAASWTWVDGCESDPVRAMEENCRQPAMLAALCKKNGCRFAYFSTTYVFDGMRAPYSEEDLPGPVNVYARSKWEGEQAVMKSLDGGALIPRVIFVWGREPQEKNFACQVVRAIREGRTMRVPSDQTGNPTWAGDIAGWLVDLMEANEAGVWNLVSGEPGMTKSGWASEILHGLNGTACVSADKLSAWVCESVPTDQLGQAARRPLHCGGLDDKIQSRFPKVPRKPCDISILFS